MRTRSWSLIAGLLLTVSLVEATRGAEPVEIGTKIYAKSLDIQIRVEDRIIGTGGDLAYPLRVRKVNGDWLWIWVDEKKTEGWIKRSDVCTASEAITYFTQQIASNPNGHNAYFMRSAAWQELGNLDKSLDDETQLIRLRPTAYAYHSRGTLWSTKREYDIAIKDYDEAIRLDPKFVFSYTNRGTAWLFKGELDKAIADYNEAIRLDPKSAGAFDGRGVAHQAKGEFAKALDDFDESLRLDPKQGGVLYDRAWLRATCPDPKFRDPDSAIADAMKAGELMKWTPDQYNDPASALAAAYADAGQFEKAVEWQQKALQKVSAKKKPDYSARLELYLSGKPYRQELKSQ